jgi:hypothetical protein
MSEHLQSRPAGRAVALQHALLVAVVGVFPLGLLVLWMVYAAGRDAVAVDLETGYLPAARLILDGVSPYPALTYPPLVPTLLAPLSPLPGLDWIATVFVAACVPASLWLLGVRDWRCYTVAFLWQPVLSGVQTANVTLPLVLLAAAAWRLREKPAPAALATGLGIAAKFVGIPFAVWLAATGRFRAAIGSVVLAAVVTLGLLALIGDGLTGDGGFADGTANVTTNPTTPSYGIVDLADWAGLGLWTGRGLTALATAIPVAGILWYARARRDERRAFACAAAATLVIAPNVWLHSFSFLLLVVAILRPRFGPLWLAPAVLFVSVDDPAVWEVAYAWAFSLAVVVWCLLPDEWAPERLLRKEAATPHQSPLSEKLAAVRRRSAASPHLDSRTAVEILDYDEHGLPR